MKPVLLLTGLAVFSALASASSSVQQSQSISFTIVVGNFNQAGSTIGGGICLGNRRVTDPKRYSGVRWSPDGRRFVFWRQAGGRQANVFVADADGGNERNLTSDFEGFNWSPDWSPDGERIVFNGAGPAVTQLVVMHADGSNKVALGATALPESRYVAQPSWSSKDEIVYTRAERSSEPPSLWTIRPDGSQHRLFRAEAYDADWAPEHWNPDGEWLVYVSRGDLFVGDRFRWSRLTNSQEFAEEDPQWSPDGQTIATLSLDQRDPKVYNVRDEMLLIDAARGAARFLRGPLGAWSPTWRPSTDRVPGERRCVIAGTRGADVLRGTARGDLIYGGRGNDVIRAGGGNDVLFGEGGADRLLAGPGADVIGAQDSKRDHVDGGAGSDRARVDRRRDRVRSIESFLP